ncbi:MAG: hypothetical protein ACBR50_25415 [Microcoleus sp.]
MNEDTRLCIVHDSTLFGKIFSIARSGWKLFPGVFSQLKQCSGQGNLCRGGRNRV